MLLLPAFLIAACLAVALAAADSTTDHFELGDSVDPELPGTGELLSVGGLPGPDWEELFNADGSLKDLVGSDGQPPPNGVPDFIDLYQGRDALFVGDDVSAGTATDFTMRFGVDRLETGPVSSVHDVGNAYVYLTTDGTGRLLLYLGVERIATGASDIEFELNQGIFRLGHGWPGLSGWEIVGTHAQNDARIKLNLGETGLLTSLEIDAWQDPDGDGTFGWVRRETLTSEGCNPGNPEATPPVEARTACAFRNASAIPGGGWPTYDSNGQPGTDIDKDRFYEIGLNLGNLFGLATSDLAYKTVRLKTPDDLAFGYFGEGN